jgi:hypothetical protein
MTGSLRELELDLEPVRVEYAPVLRVVLCRPERFLAL